MRRDLAASRIRIPNRNSSFRCGPNIFATKVTPPSFLPSSSSECPLFEDLAGVQGKEESLRSEPRFSAYLFFHYAAAAILHITIFAHGEDGPTMNACMQLMRWALLHFLGEGGKEKEGRAAEGPSNGSLTWPTYEVTRFLPSSLRIPEAS